MRVINYNNENLDPIEADLFYEDCLMKAEQIFDQAVRDNKV